jgi:ectoine hydroxylase-related dioxygenase (phytanoyl-CoA dioxygenase family)
VSLQVNPTFKPEYEIDYDILTQYLPERARKVEVYATPEEVNHLATQGFLVRERLFTGESLEHLRTAIDELTEQEIQGKDVAASRRFGGLFLRHLMDKHECFLDFLKFQPLLSIARAVLGPLVQIRGLSARIAFPGQPNQETQWHIHQQVVPKPLPPFFSYPHGLDCLIYLDDLTDEIGPLAVLPGSHLWVSEFIEPDDFADRSHQSVLRVPAGSCVIIHSNVWHRALPTIRSTGKRRLLILTYVPTWMRQAPYGVKPESGLTERLLANGDPETKELLGVGGYT